MLLVWGLSSMSLSKNMWIDFITRGLNKYHSSKEKYMHRELVPYEGTTTTAKHIMGMAHILQEGAITAMQWLWAHFLIIITNLEKRRQQNF